MTNKLVSFVILLSLAAILVVARVNPQDPLFYFISINPTVSGLRFLLVAGLAGVAFKGFFRRAASRNAVAGFGAVLAVFGLTTLLLPLGSVVYVYLLPLDQLLMVGTGVIFTAAAFDKKIKPIYRETKPADIPVKATV